MAAAVDGLVESSRAADAAVELSPGQRRQRPVPGRQVRLHHPGAPLIQYTCTGNANQRWRLTLTTGGVTLTAVSSGLSLAVADTTEGSTLVQRTPNPADMKQVWSLRPVQ